MNFKIRPYHPSDLPSLYRICIQTGDNGKDISPLFPDQELFGNYYSAPYGVYEPDLCFTLTYDGIPCGYVLGARDTHTFNQRCEREWFPVLRERYPLPPESDHSEPAQMIRNIHRGYRESPDTVDYPAHLHIDLLPVAQGQGLGGKMIATFLANLRSLRVPAVHLGVGAANTRAIAFYRKVGFHVIREYEWGIFFGMRLQHPLNPADF
jgi:ribosomal protein S18 acetylase RimI-like enzyme